jgi:YNFM family putative membrane transporter
MIAARRGVIGTAVLGQLFDRLGWIACVAGIACSFAVVAVLAKMSAVET